MYRRPLVASGECLVSQVPPGRGFRWVRVGVRWRLRPRTLLVPLGCWGATDHYPHPSWPCSGSYSDWQYS